MSNEPITPKIRAMIAACESAGLGGVSVNISIQELKQLLAENQPGFPDDVMRDFDLLCFFLLGELPHPSRPEINFGDAPLLKEGSRIKRHYWWRSELLRPLMAKMGRPTA